VIATTIKKVEVMDIFIDYLNPSIKHQLVIGHKVCHLADGKLGVPHLELKRTLQVEDAPVTSYTSLQLDITISLEEGIVQRRVVLPSTYTLYELHVVIQKAFGWRNSHIHMFQPDDPFVSYGNPLHFEHVNKDVLEERFITIKDAFDNWKEWDYIYDFGDDWVHHIVCILTEHTKDPITPQCIHHVGDNIPEDVGGVPGYEYFLEVINDIAHDDHENMKEWIEFIEYQSFDINLLNYSLSFEQPLMFYYQLLGNPQLRSYLMEKFQKENKE
jgi:hypothetical protein